MKQAFCDGLIVLTQELISSALFSISFYTSSFFFPSVTGFSLSFLFSFTFVPQKSTILMIVLCKRRRILIGISSKYFLIKKIDITSANKLKTDLNFN